MAYLNAAFRSRINRTAHAQAILFEIELKKKLIETISKKIESGANLNEIHTYLGNPPLFNGDQK